MGLLQVSVHHLQKIFALCTGGHFSLPHPPVQSQNLFRGKLELFWGGGGGGGGGSSWASLGPYYLGIGYTPKARCLSDLINRVLKVHGETTKPEVCNKCILATSGLNKWLCAFTLFQTCRFLNRWQAHSTGLLSSSTKDEILHARTCWSPTSHLYLQYRNFLSNPM